MPLQRSARSAPKPKPAPEPELSSPECEALRLKALAVSLLQSASYKPALKYARRARALSPDLPAVRLLITSLKILTASPSDHYRTLRLPLFATLPQIHTQFKTLTLALKPDNSSYLPGTELAFNRISTSYNFLSDPANKDKYDDELRIMREKDDDRTAEEGSTFWTACATCRILHEFDRRYLGSRLVCPGCNKGFVANEMRKEKEKGDDVRVFETRSRSRNQSRVLGNGDEKKRKVGVLGDLESKIVVKEKTLAEIQKEIANARAKKKEKVKRSKKATIFVEEEQKRSKKGRVIVEEEVEDGEDELLKEIAKDGSKKKEKRKDSKNASVFVEEEEDENEEEELLKDFAKEISRKKEKRKDSKKTRFFVEEEEDEEEEFLKDFAKKSSKKKEKRKDSKKARIFVEEDEEEDEEEEFLKKMARERSRKKEQRKMVLAEGEDEEEDLSVVAMVLAEGEDEEEEDLSVVAVEDSDFYNFDKDRTEKSFRKGQIWAVYDDDGMPRHYGLIEDVAASHRFKVKMSWLDFEKNGDEGLDLGERVGKDHVSCGRFKVGKKVDMDSLNCFSHYVEGERAGKEVYRVYPKKGSVWALYGERAVGGKVRRSYDIVVFLTSYSEMYGLSMAHLEKVEGYKTIFKRREIGPHAITWLEKANVRLFSHQIPARKLMGEEDENLPSECWELDPASLPSRLL